MVLGGLFGSGDVGALIAAKKYAKAIEVLKEQLQRSSGDARMRMQLADVLVMAGRDREAIPVLIDLADRHASQGEAAKAIAVLKKIERIEPGRADVEVKLASLIKGKDRPKRPGAGWSPTGARGFEPQSWGQAFGADHFDPTPEVDSTARIEAARKASWVPSTRADDEPSAGQPPLAAGPSALPPPPVVSTDVPASEPSPEPEIMVEPEPEISPDAFRGQVLDVIQYALRPDAPVATAPAASADETVDEVKESPLFDGFEQDELVAVIRGLRLLSFAPGDIIVGEGDAGDSLFVLTSGQVKAFVKDAAGPRPRLVREMGEGDFFGEISILSGKPRTATITAATPCELLELDRPTLDTITRDYPNVQRVLEEFYIQRATGS